VEGPPWLAKDRRAWPIEIASTPTEVPELKTQAIVSHSISLDTSLFTRFSSLSRLKRIAAYCLRFRTNTYSKEKCTSGPLSVEELDRALSSLIRVAQSNEFATEMEDLQANKEISRKSTLLTLNPFLDETQLLRVGVGFATPT